MEIGIGNGNSKLLKQDRLDYMDDQTQGMKEKKGLKTIPSKFSEPRD